MNTWTEESLAEAYRRNPDLPRKEVRVEQPEPSGAVSAAPDQLEAPIQGEVTKLLQEDGWRALRTEPVSDRGRGKGFGEVGMADYMYIRYTPFYRQSPDSHYMSASHTLWIEHKRSKGGQLSKAQREWHVRERARGALTLIAGEDFEASIEGFKRWYEKSGLMRRKSW